MKFYISIVTIFLFLLSTSACKKGPSCPAYNSVHNSKNHPYNPNNAQRAKEDNKKDIKKKREAELEGDGLKKSKREPYSLFPKGVR